MTRTALQPLPHTDAPDAAPAADAGTAAHREALDGLKLAMLARKRLLVLAGGTSDERQALFDRLTGEIAADGALVLPALAHPGSDVEALVATAGADATGQPDGSDRFDSLIDELERRLDLAGSGLLAIREAQRLAPDTLLDLVELSGTESAQGRALQVMLCGASALERTLAAPALARALRDHGVIYRLSATETPSLRPDAAHRPPVDGTRAAPAQRPARRPGRILPWAAAAGAALALGATAMVPGVATEMRHAQTTAVDAWHGARAFILNEPQRRVRPPTADAGNPAAPVAAVAGSTAGTPDDAVAPASPAAARSVSQAASGESAPRPAAEPAVTVQVDPPAPAHVEAAAVAQTPPASPPAQAATPATRRPDGGTGQDSLARLLADLDGIIHRAPPVAGDPAMPREPAPLPPLAPPVAVSALPAPQALAGTADADPAGTAAADQAVADQLERLEAVAYAQIAAKKLTTPDGDNAFETVQRMQALRADAPAVAALRSEMEDIYRRWAVLARAEGDWRNARLFYQRALTIDPTDAELQALLDEMEARIGGTATLAGG